MTADDDARAHLLKAEEFLAAAEANFGAQLFSAAASDAVIAGINAKDAICLVLNRETLRRATHADVVRELRSVGASGVQLAPVLGRLLAMKTRSQYQTDPITRRESELALRWSARLYQAAEGVVPRGTD